MTAGPALSDERLLEIQGVSLWLSGRKVLDDVSFTLRPGEFTGLIGSNGAARPRCCWSSSACRPRRPARCGWRASRAPGAGR